MDCDVANIDLSGAGQLRVEWADIQMPVLRQIREQFEKDKPLAGQRIAACLHVTTETANLMKTLVAGGAEVRLCASNPLSTQDDAAAWLARDLGIGVFAVHGEDRDTYYRHINAVLDMQPTITIDDGADLISTLHSDRQALIPNIIAGMEETTTGVIRLRAMAADGALRYPLVAVNEWSHIPRRRLVWRGRLARVGFPLPGRLRRKREDSISTSCKKDPGNRP